MKPEKVVNLGMEWHESEGEDERITLQEYYASEDQAEYKREYYDGSIWSMAGGTKNHSIISANINRALGNALEDKPCVVCESNLSIYISQLDSILYPDASVFCEPMESDPATANAYKNPSMIIEVLSPSTADYDRGNKFQRYQMIPSLKTYVLLEQLEPLLMLYERDDDQVWNLSIFSGLDSVVQFELFGIAIPMAKLYKWVSFGES